MVPCAHENFNLNIILLNITNRMVNIHSIRPTYKVFPPQPFPSTQFVPPPTHVEQLLPSEGLPHGSLAVVQGGGPGVEQEGQSQLARGVAGEGLLDGDEVLETLAHLTALNGEVPGVEEVGHPAIVTVARLQGGSTQGGSTRGGSTQGGQHRGGQYGGVNTGRVNTGGSTQGGQHRGGQHRGVNTGGSTQGGSTQEGQHREGQHRGVNTGGVNTGGSTQGGSTQGGSTRGGSTQVSLDCPLVPHTRGVRECVCVWVCVWGRGSVPRH